MQSESKKNHTAKREQRQIRQAEYSRMEQLNLRESAVWHMRHKPYSICMADRGLNRRIREV